MDRTPNRGYPYPQCNPPLTKDASDAPMQTRDLAEAIDADLTVIDDAAYFNYQRPVALLSRSLGTTIPSVGVVDWNVIQYSLGDITILPSGFQVLTAGLYYSTANVFQTSGTGLALSWIINGTAVVRQGTTSVPRASGEFFDVLNVGDTVQLAIIYGGAGSAQSGNFSLTRVAAA